MILDGDVAVCFYLVLLAHCAVIFAIAQLFVVHLAEGAAVLLKVLLYCWVHMKLECIEDIVWCMFAGLLRTPLLLMPFNF